MFEQEYMALEERLAEMSELKNEYDGCTKLLEYDERCTKTVLYTKLDNALNFMGDKGIASEHVKEIIRMIENKVSEIRMNDASKLRDYLN
jgi:hypothetical protein